MSGIINQGWEISRYRWKHIIMFVRTASGASTARRFNLSCQFVCVLAESKWPVGFTEVAPRVSFFPHSAFSLTRGISQPKRVPDTSRVALLLEIRMLTRTRIDTHTLICANTLLKAILIEFPIVNSECLFNSIQFSLFV